MIPVNTHNTHKDSRRYSYPFSNKKNRLLFATFVAGGVVAILSIQAASSEPNLLVDDSTSESILNPVDNNNDSTFVNEQTLDANHSSGDVVEISDNNVSVSVGTDSQADIDQSDSSISVRIESKSETSDSGTSSSEEPTLSINGQEVDIPSNGRINQTIRDENTRTRLRADVDGNGSSSISISTETSN